MISLHRSMHSSQMYTPGPAISFLTCFWLFPQKEHLSRSPSPMRATGWISFASTPALPSGGAEKALTQEGTAFRAGTGAGRRSLAAIGLPRGAGSRPGECAVDGSARLARHAFRAAGDDLVDQAVLDRLSRRQNLVPLDVLAH